MPTRGGIIDLVRIAPEIDTTVLSAANARLLVDRAQIDLSLRGRALPKNEKVNVTAETAEYVVSGASSVLTDNDFLAIDLRGGGVLFSNGSSWFGPQTGFIPKTREWLDLNHPGWRTESSAATPLYWYLDTKEDASSDLVVGLFNKPSTTRANGLWIHYLSRGKLPTDDTHYLWTGSTTQLVHLEPYEMLVVWWIMEYYQRFIAKNSTEADKFKMILESGITAMAQRLPLMEHLAREGFTPPPYFSGRSGGRRY